MIRSFLTVTFVLSMVLTISGEDGSQWLAKEPALWSLQDAEQILWNSPWVQESRFRFFNSRRRIRQITYYVRLQSARPVRLALAKAFLSQPERNVVSVKRTDPQEIEELSEQFRIPDELVFSLIISPRFVHHRLNDTSSETVRQTSLVQLGDQAVPLKEFVPPEKTTFGEAWFRFPRPKVNSDVDKIQFVTRLEIPYRVSIKAEFQISKLLFLGELEF
jgi:hypothetical protein